MIQKRLIVLFILLACARAHAGEIFSAPVIGVQDGDTITVLHEMKPLKIRILGVDCPEKRQPFGERAKLFTSSLVFGQVVDVGTSRTDRYGRTLGAVFVGTKDVSKELLRAGLAWHYRQYSHDATLQELEDEAREAKRGLWSVPDPTPPWAFRKARKQ